MTTPEPGVAAAFAEGRDTPSSRLARRLDILKDRDPDIRAFVTRLPDADAMALARQSDRRWREGAPLSPLDGATVAVKDIVETRDMPTGQGSPLWEGTHTGRDAATVMALRAAGVIVLGKTTTTEFAATHVYHDTINPNDATRTPGGSSAGSAAAVAAGMVDLAIGSQVVGSTIRPASYCGCHGFKPSLGTLNRGGSYDNLSQSCVGLFAAEISDLWYAARTIADRVGGDPGSVPFDGPSNPPPAVRPKRLAILHGRGWQQATPGARAAFDAQLNRFRAAGIDCLEAANLPQLQAVEEAIAVAFDLTLRICAFESLWPLSAYDAAAISPPMQHRLERARSLSAQDYAADLARREEIRATYAELAAHCDAVVTLSATGAAPVGHESTGDPSFAVPASLLGCPALSLPLLADAGMPLGLQLMGWPRGDAPLFALAQAVLR